MKKRIWAMMMILAMAVTVAACGTNGGTTDPDEGANGGSGTDQVTIIITNGKGEIASQWEQAARDFSAANPDIIVEAHSGAVGDTLDVLDRLTASGRTVTIAMMEPSSVLYRYKDWGIDLSDERWNEETDDAFTDEEGRIVGFPFAIEGFGLVYNKQVVENAVGGEFDPFSINTRDKLIELLDTIQASGIQYPVAYQTETWSVSNHYSTQFLNQVEDGSTIVAQLEEGSFDLASNETWNGYYDTLDLLVSQQYNKYGERPLDRVYDDSHLSVGRGESAILFNGNWAFDSLQAVADEEFGFIPVPVDNNPDNRLNNSIVAGPTQILAINRNATPEQQEAAKRFLDWLVYEDAGKDFLVNQSQVISAFRNNEYRVTNPLGAAIADAVAAGRTVPFSTNYVIANDWNTIIGPDVQRYIVNQATREQLAQVIESYYTSN